MIFKVALTMTVLFIGFGCQTPKRAYYVEEVNDDNCTEGYYRLKLKAVTSDSIFQVLSIKTDNIELVQKTINEGDILKIRIVKTKMSDWNLENINMRSHNYFFYCDDKIILKSNECFYKSEKIIGLKLVK